MTEEEYRELLRTKIMPDYEALKERIVNEGLLQPAVVYGYFPCQSEGDDLIVYDDGRRRPPGSGSRSPVRRGTGGSACRTISRRWNPGAWTSSLFSL